VELRHLRYFIRAAELLNFTKAAESLYVSQPTLSVQIHQLEEELGSPLFARVGRNVQLTESGKVFLARAYQAVKALEMGGRELDALRGLLRGQVLIGSLPLYGSTFLADCVHTFKSVHPDVYVKVKVGTSEDLETAVLAGNIELALTILTGHTADFSSRELIKDEIVLVASCDHEVAKKKKLSASDFENLHMVLPSERVSATHLLGIFFEQNNIHPNIAMSFDDGHALLEIVKKGRYVTFLPRLAVGVDPALCTLSLPSPGMPIAVGAIWANLSPASQALLDLMTKEANPWQEAIVDR